MTAKERERIFNCWMDQHQAHLFKVIRSYTFTPQDQDDLFQEIALQVWRSVPHFRKESKASTWIYRVVLNTALKWNRAEQKHQKGRKSFENSPQLLQRTTHNADERLDWLYREIRKLYPIDRSLCLLMLDGFSYQEMADMLGISETNVGVKIHRIKKHLIHQSENWTDYGI